MPELIGKSRSYSDVTFQTGGSVDISKTGLSFSLLVQQISAWNNVFGVKGLSVKNMGMKVTFAEAMCPVSACISGFAWVVNVSIYDKGAQSIQISM